MPAIERTAFSASKLLTQKKFNFKKKIFFDQTFLILTFSEIYQNYNRVFENPIVIFQYDFWNPYCTFGEFSKISKSKNLNRKKIFFLKLTKFFVNSFDAEKAVLSIGGIFRAIWALSETLEQIAFYFPLLQQTPGNTRWPGEIFWDTQIDDGRRHRPKPLKSKIISGVHFL